MSGSPLHVHSPDVILGTELAMTACRQKVLKNALRDYQPIWRIRSRMISL